MGNYNTIQGGKGYVKRSKRKKLAIDDSLNKPVPTHDGIKSVMADNLCNFSTNSDLCICMVTWNMNGRVSYEDLVELFGNNRGFDLLVVGLQEVPRKDLARLLQDALVDTHELLGVATMQSLQLYVFGTKNSYMFVEEMKVDKHGVGGCGGMRRRKKGAVAISINYKGLKLVFITCHLSGKRRFVSIISIIIRHP
ncbi:hypothetical protein Goari_003781 [Gossypium aridum]|uniref:Inositol polyphosphate-related phosphatase domain-containing protein n=3 Tax=Gossypium TaxID=3633 RepID=A0A7J8Y1G1_GOSAI|nr:hypothetical protein [Gossypium aridum]